APAGRYFHLQSARGGVHRSRHLHCSRRAGLPRALGHMDAAAAGAEPAEQHEGIWGCSAVAHAHGAAAPAQTRPRALHACAGVPRTHLVELHGSCFRELCHRCGAEYQRAFELESIGQKATRRRCTSVACVALGTAPRLRDSVLDWEDALPPSELERAEDECSKADLVLCLATSLQITPAANLPLRALRNGGRMVIVNLQKTPKDKKASLVIASRVDQVMAHLMASLRLTIPPFHRTYSLHIRHCLTPTQPRGKGKAKKHAAAAHPPEFTNRWKLSVAVESTLGALAPLPSLDCIQVSFPESWPLDELTLSSPPYTFNRTFKLQMQQADREEGEGEKQQQQQGTTPLGAISFTFNFSQGYECDPITIHHAIAPCPYQEPAPTATQGEEHSVTYNTTSPPPPVPIPPVPMPPAVPELTLGSAAASPEGKAMPVSLPAAPAAAAAAAAGAGPSGEPESAVPSAASGLAEAECTFWEGRAVGSVRVLEQAAGGQHAEQQGAHGHSSSGNHTEHGSLEARLDVSPPSSSAHVQACNGLLENPEQGSGLQKGTGPMWHVVGYEMLTAVVRYTVNEVKRHRNDSLSKPQLICPSAANPLLLPHNMPLLSA
ncbi:unnamed protein product, partial [Closterium sp. Naga37s-1]